MAIPRVFISSTCYDLKHIRENLKYLVQNIGYEPVLSEEGDVFYSPMAHTHDSCLNEVTTCQIFVLIIGGRFGGKYKETEKSITNEEYNTAVQNNIPIFTLVDSGVYSDHHIYTSNKSNSNIDRNKISYTSSDSIRIFEFLDLVRKNSKNNAVQPFHNFYDIEQYLKKQWAGMMFEFLQNRKSESQSIIITRLLDQLTLASSKTEELVKVLVGKADKENASNIIRNIDKVTDAKKFPKRILSKWRIKSFKTHDINKLMNISLDQPWYKYLENAFDFIFDPDVNGEDAVLFPPPESDGVGVAIGTIIRGRLILNDELEKESFETMRTLDDTQKKDVLMVFINGV